MRRIRLLILSAAILVSLSGLTAFTETIIASAHSQAQATSKQTTRSSHPLVTCSTSGCNGQNPATTGCSADAFTVQTAVFSNSFVELRYSPTCGTNWGRVTSKVGPTFLEIRIQRIDGLTYTFSGGNFNFAYSAMVYAPVAKARACGGVSGITGCTAYI